MNAIIPESITLRVIEFANQGMDIDAAIWAAFKAENYLIDSLMWGTDLTDKGKAVSEFLMPKVYNQNRA